MYLCFVDESGTHGGSPVLVVGGIIVHEEDAWHLQQRLDSSCSTNSIPSGTTTPGLSYTPPSFDAAPSSGQASGRTTATGSWQARTVRWLATPPSPRLCRGVSSGPSWNATPGCQEP